MDEELTSRYEWDGEKSYNELRERILEVEKKLSSLIGTLIVFRWMGLALFTAFVSLGWTMCSRAIDNEKQITINTGIISSLLSRVINIETIGSASERLTSAQVIDLQSRFTDFISKYDLFTHDEIERDSSTNQGLSELKGRISNREFIDTQFIRSLNRINDAQQKLIEREFPKDHP